MHRSLSRTLSRHALLSRRAVLKMAGTTTVVGVAVAAGATVAGIAATALSSRRSAGAEPSRLDVKDPTALALGYVEDAAQIDGKKFTDYVRGSNCENCLQLQGSAGSTYRPCGLFPGKLVAVGGWCKSWTPEM